MINIEENKDLSPYLTMKVGAKASFFTIVSSREDLLDAIAFAKKNSLPIFVLGGGSNTIFSNTFSGLVVKNEIKGLRIAKDNKNNSVIEAMSGETWMKLVNYSVELGLSGLENLASIYGTVGAAPIQNIGAYGAEMKDSFHSLVAIDLKSGKEKIFKLEDCFFAYRNSVFKNKYKGRYFVYSVSFRLQKKFISKLDYGAIKEELAKRKISRPEPKDIAFAVHSIRSAKLPNPSLLPNAGSFFKNPEIKASDFKKLKAKHPDTPSFPGEKGGVKIPAGWLIEKAGFKGKKIGRVGMYEKQALIMVNYGGAQAEDISVLSAKIKAAVKKLFAIDLEEEVNII